MHACYAVDIHVDDVHPPCRRVQLVMSQLVSGREPLTDDRPPGIHKDKSLTVDESVAPVDVAVVGDGMADGNSSPAAQDGKRIDPAVTEPKLLT